MIDLNHIPARHDAIHARLEEWNRWVRVKPQLWATQPMFRQYKAPRQHEHDAHVSISINTLAAHEIERAVSMLPDKHRTAIRWAYVFSHVPDARIRVELGVTQVYLVQLINEGRTMLINRMREKIKEVN